MYERKHTIRININLYEVGKRTVLLTLFHEIVHLKLKLRKSVMITVLTFRKK